MEEREAYQLLKEGKYQEALEVLQKIVEESPTESSLFNISLALYRLERLEEAREHLQRLLEMNPEHQKGLFLLGVVCRRLGDMECAREAFERAHLEELKECIPEVVVKEPSEDEMPEVPETEEIISLDEEAPSEAPSEQPQEEKVPAKLLRFYIDGTLTITNGRFLALVAQDGDVEERAEEVVVKGKGEIFISCEEAEGSILADSGEGQLMITTGEEKLILKTNPEDKVFYKENPLISWRKF